MVGECATIYSCSSSPLGTNHPRQVLCEIISLGVPWAYFDGVAAWGLCGARMIIQKSSDIFFAAFVGLGLGTNNFVELHVRIYCRNKISTERKLPQE